MRKNSAVIALAIMTVSTTAVTICRILNILVIFLIFMPEVKNTIRDEPSEMAVKIRSALELRILECGQ